MQLECEELPGEVTRIALSGRLDIEGTRSIDDRFAFLTTTRPKKIVVDLSDVSFLASIGIRLLLTSARAQQQRGGKVVLASPQPSVRKVLEAAGIDQLIALLDDVETGRASLVG